jgi:protein involved in polysaccharide export with SLBB domain
MGAVRSPQGLYLKNGMQLKQAIAMVGGLGKDAKGSAVVIWRKKKGQSEPEKMIINYNDIKKEKVKDIELQPYDIVEVPDNSGSLANTVRGMLMGVVGSSAQVLGQTVVPRVIY